MAASPSAPASPDGELELEILHTVAATGEGSPLLVEPAVSDEVLTVWIDDLRESVEDVLEPARRATAHSGVAVGSFVHRIGLRRKQRIADRNPRRQSRLRLHLFVPYDAARSRIPGIGVIGRTRGGRLELDGSFSPFRSGVRAPGTLVLRGSWPGLPVWIDIEPWWRRQTIVTMSLRTTSRVRYPRRYFASSFRILRTFVATLARTDSISARGRSGRP